jgi:hypothetical protein
MSDEKRTSPDASEPEHIEELPPPDPTPETDADVKGGWLPPMKTPSPVGPIPIPYPILP